VASADRAVVDIVAVLSKAGEAMTAGRERDSRAALSDAATRMTTLLRTAAPSSSSASPTASAASALWALKRPADRSATSPSQRAVRTPSRRRCRSSSSA
jgi:hypothetical protein